MCVSQVASSTNLQPTDGRTDRQMAHEGWPTGVTVRPRLLIDNGGRDGMVKWHGTPSLVAGASGTLTLALTLAPQGRYAIFRFPFPVPRSPSPWRSSFVCMPTCLPPATAQITTRATATATDGRKGGRTEKRTSTASEPERAKKDNGKKRGLSKEEKGKKRRTRREKGETETERGERRRRRRRRKSPRELIASSANLRHVSPRLALHQDNGGTGRKRKEAEPTRRTRQDREGRRQEYKTERERHEEHDSLGGIAQAPRLCDEIAPSVVVAATTRACPRSPRSPARRLASSSTYPGVGGPSKNGRHVRPGVALSCPLLPSSRRPAGQFDPG